MSMIVSRFTARLLESKRKWSVEITTKCTDGGNPRDFSRSQTVPYRVAVLSSFSAGLVPAILCPGGAEQTNLDVESAESGQKVCKDGHLMTPREGV